MNSTLILLLITYAIVFIFVGKLISKKWPPRYRPIFWLILAIIGVYSYTHA